MCVHVSVCVQVCKVQSNFSLLFVSIMPKKLILGTSLWDLAAAQ